MSILDRLTKEPPRHTAPPGSFNPKYQVTKHYMTEIEAARQKGYSWNQIKKAVVAEANAEGIWDGSWVGWDLGSVYWRVKKGL